MNPNFPDPEANSDSNAPAGSGEYEAVGSFDRATVEMKKELEPKVYDKVMSDMNHVVWAYGIIFALFAAYGAYLWRRSVALHADVEALRRELEKKK